MRYLGLGERRSLVVDVDDQGRAWLDALEALAATLDQTDGGPLIVCLQAGNVHSGAFAPLDAAIALAHRHSAWVQVSPSGPTALGRYRVDDPVHLARSGDPADLGVELADHR